MKKKLTSLANVLFCSWPTPLLTTMFVVLVTACSDKPREFTPIERPSTDNSIPSRSDDLPPITVSRQDTALIQFPPDINEDDRPGLIITGLHGQDPSYLTSPWLVNTGMFRLASKTPGTGDGYADLIQYRNDFPLAEHIRFFVPPLDSCREHSVDNVMSAEHTDESPPRRIRGGRSVVINTAAGPWFTYQEEYENGETRYMANNTLPAAFPESATLSIPGGAFPTVAAHPLFEPRAVERLLPDSATEITAESEYTWTPGNRSGFVKIHLLAYDANDSFQGFAVTCWVTDDGDFTMPDKIRSFIASIHTDLRLVARYSRVYARLDLVNGIVIFQNNEVAE